jgi:hypothetical protein
MRLAVASPRDQLRRGLELLRTVLRDAIDPFGPMPERTEWQPYRAAKERNQLRRAEVKRAARVFPSCTGQGLGFVETAFIGALGVLYEIGCDVAIGLNPAFGAPPVRKFTIGGNPARGTRVDHLAAALNALEPGWGGPAHGTIIASPRTGSRLDADTVIGVVIAHA